MRHRGVVVLLAVAALLAGCSGDDGDAGPTTLPGDGVADGAEVERPGGSTDGIGLVDFDDRPVELDDFAGRPLVVNLFASWCAPCVREMPDIEAVKQEVGEEVTFLGIATNDRVEDALELVEDTGITWELARDPQGRAANALGVVRMPTTFLVSPEGEVVEHHGGVLGQGELRDLLREHFGVEA